MKTELASFSKAAKGLSSNPLGIIALFLVLVYSFACLLFIFSASHLSEYEKLPIINFVVWFPVAVLIVFSWLVSRHHDKLYAPTDYRDDASFLETIGQKPVESNNSSARVEDLLNYGSEFEIVSKQKTEIEAEMTNRGMDTKGETIEALIQQLAAAQVLNWFEITYRNIFGTQIKLLKQLIAKNGMSNVVVQVIFHMAKKDHPNTLGLLNLEEYLKFMQTSGLIEVKDGNYYATSLGREFIRILNNLNYPVDKGL